MRRIFVDDELEREISAQGYAVVRDFAPMAVCDDLYSFFDSTDSIDKRAFTITNWNGDTEYRQKTHDKIAGSIARFAHAYLEDYRPVIGVFAAKRPGTKSDMLLHQDWSLVDETKFRSVSIWLALCDMDRNNGNIQMAGGSHHYAGAPRGMNIPVPFEKIRDQFQHDFLTDVPLKKGDAVIFDHRTIHASPANLSAGLRLAAVLAFIPQEAELIHYFKDLDNENELEILEMNDKGFFLIDFFDMPNKPQHISVKGKVAFSFHELNIDELANIGK